MAPHGHGLKPAARPTVATRPPAETNSVSSSFGRRTAPDQVIGKNPDMPPSDPGSNEKDRDVLTSLPRTRPARRSAKRDRPPRRAPPPAAPPGAAGRAAAGGARGGGGERHAGAREGHRGVQAEGRRERPEGQGAVVAGQA